MAEGVQPPLPPEDGAPGTCGPGAPPGGEDANSPAAPLWDCLLPPGPWRGLCTWQCWHQRVLEHLVQERTPDGPSRTAQVTFEDVAVYFSPEEWAELAAWQKALYWDVMKENHTLVASLGSAHDHQPEALSRIARGEAPPPADPPGGKREAAPRDPSPGAETDGPPARCGTASGDAAQVGAGGRAEAEEACRKSDSKEEAGLGAPSTPNPGDHQSALDQVRQRAAHWTLSETKAFVELWGEDRVQTALYDNYRNEVQYKRLADRMGKMGFRRNLEQCRQRAKDLRRGFKEIQDGHLHSNRARQTMPFFSLLERFLVVSRGLVVPKVCANRARQKGRRSRSRREERPGEPPFPLTLAPDGSDWHRLPLPDRDRPQVPDREPCGPPAYRGQLTKQDPAAHPRGVPGYRPPRQDGSSLPCAAGLSGFPLRLQDQEASAVPSRLQQQEMALAPVNGLSAASSLWQEMASLPPEHPTSTLAQGGTQTWRPGKAPSSSAKRMRDLRLRRRRQRAAMARVLLGASYRPNDRTVWSKTQKTDWWDNLLASQFDSSEWVRYFRMSREAVLELVERLRPVLQREDTNMRAAIPVDKRVALTLWKLATSDSYRSVANQFGVGVSTASVIVMEVCEAIHDVLLKHVIQLGDAQAVMDGFDRAGFPNCLGVVDETHIPILCSPHGASAYINGKGLVSMVLQALVDSAGRFMDVYAGWSGGMQDSGLPWGSPLFERMERGAFGPQSTTEIGGVAMRPVLLGGPACPLRPWLMKPYPPEASGGPRERFNAVLSRCRVAVSYAFERLKGRWRCLLKRLDVAEKNVPLVILACCILHNLCESRNEAMQDGWEEGMDYGDLPSAAAAEGPGDGLCDAQEAGEAHSIREAYCALFEKRRQE
ncbi:PREDICTED: uncharacterized protein LOC107118608 [Gekko japonicus]|uniref:Uncharacterized protein LOC107118608 n=1 Tax=Gekko japonicus TaxID=146911 RepID=A0ABM1KRX0_GEKJA|nr:PREDICTED: uncharacterized protein LOC107118608 [Gekko japonicus]